MKAYCHQCLKELEEIRVRKVYYKKADAHYLRHYFWCDDCNLELYIQELTVPLDKTDRLCYNKINDYEKELNE